MLPLPIESELSGFVRRYVPLVTVQVPPRTTVKFDAETLKVSEIKVLVCICETGAKYAPTTRNEQHSAIKRKLYRFFFNIFQNLLMRFILEK